MRPGARLAAAIELLDLIEGSDRPADRLMRDWFRTRRYAGSGDRRAIGEIVFKVIRKRALLDWLLDQINTTPDNRLRTFLVIEPDELESLSGVPHAPEPPSDTEREGVRVAASISRADAPLAARLNLPDWLLAHLPQGPDAETFDTWFNSAPSTDLRVNRLKADRAAVLGALTDDGIDAAPLDLAPDAIRLAKATRLDDLKAYREGWFEVQDAGSQFVAALVDAQPGDRVADICAGAGGKTLALAADMAGEGALFALDVNTRRLKRLNARAVRAGVRLAESRAIGADEDWPGDWTGSMDRVLVDAPCSGTGTWRRQPEQRWRLTPERLDVLQATQAEVLDRAARLVRPGGRLVYATCSYLPAENETTVTQFLDREPGFSLFPWNRVLKVSNNFSILDVEAEKPWRHLTPDRHGVDGFFAAVLVRGLE